jgi:hypothetical protein
VSVRSQFDGAPPAPFGPVTLDTIGHGDPTAAPPPARFISALREWIGRLFPAVLVARLVAPEISGGMRSRA